MHMVGDNMRFIKAGFMVIALSCLCYFAYLARKNQLQDKNTLNMIVLSEILFVLLIAIVLLQYIMKNRVGKKGKVEQNYISPNMYIIIQLTSTKDNKKDVIYALLRDVLIIGSDSNTTHITMRSCESICTQHCKLYYKEDTIYIKDMDTIQGTFVNNNRILNATRLSLGDIIAFGTNEYQIEWKICELDR